MSMNINIRGVREAFCFVKGEQKNFLDYKDFNSLQTPTKVSYEIDASKDQAQAYLNWVLKDVETYDEIIEDEDYDVETQEFFATKRKYNFRKEHAEEFKKFLAECDENGYTVEYYVM